MNDDRKRSRRQVIRPGSVLAAACLWVLTAAAPAPQAADALMVLEAGKGSTWYRGNTHAHTLWSDGDAPPEVVVDWYRERGYQFLCLSDHNILASGAVPKLHPITPDGHLTPKRVEDLRRAYGKQWVAETSIDGRPYLRLKTLPELKSRFERPGKFILIPAEELTAWNPNVHVNAINVAEAIAPTNEDSVEASLIAMLDAIEEQSRRTGRPMLGHINHPNWAEGITAEQIIAIEGERFFEVYNGHPGVRNWGSTRRGLPPTDRLWDIILSMRLRAGGRPLLGLATDDAHEYYEHRTGLSNSGRGWIMVLAAELKPDAIVRAMRAGRFYATTGVELASIRHEATELRIAMREEAGVEYRVEFIGTLRDFDPTSTAVVDADGDPVRGATRRYSDAIGTVLAESSSNPAVYRFTGNELYVRARIVSSRLQKNPFAEGDHEMAWTQPVRGHPLAGPRQ